MFGALPAGVYNLKIEDANACNSTGNATIGQRNSRPEPNFLVASKNYALDTLVLTEIGIPKPDAVSWQFDPRAIIIDPNPAAPRIRFLEEGSYTISLTSFFGDCAYVTTKTIRLQPYDPNRKPDNLPGVRPIEQFSVTPNPTTGEFSVYVKLNKKRNLSLVVFDATGIRMFTQNFEDVQEVTLPGSLANAAAGLYIVRAITEAEAKEVRLIVNR
ncbi:MAG: T9SS type A sorting domain-containing protein [Cyclobacteriaceae bacterium]